MGRRTVEFILFIIPFVAQLLVVGWVNSVHATVIGLPFFLFWWLLWLILTPFFTFAIYRLRKSQHGEADW